MADFRLKLEDNKVAEWREHYLDYEALKKILKRYKAAEKRYHVLYRRDPTFAQQITESYRSGEPTAILSILDPSSDSNSMEDDDDDFSKSKAMNNNISFSRNAETTGFPPVSFFGLRLPLARFWVTCGEDGENASTTDTATERSFLLQSKGSFRTVTTCTNGSYRGREKGGPSRQDSIKEALSSISDLLSLSNNKMYTERYARKIDHVLQEMDDQLAAFDERFIREQMKVKLFYYDKLSELEDRLQFLRSSVALAASEQMGYNGSHGNSAILDEVNGGGKYVSPFLSASRKRHRKQQSSSTHQTEEVYRPILPQTCSDASLDTMNSYSNTPGHSNLRHENHHRRVTDVQLGSLLQDDSIYMGGVDDTEDDYDFDTTGSRRGLDEFHRVAQAESIKRSVVSQYRNAKFLQNYSMLNITGFVKIAKKFDQVVPMQAGKYKSALEARNMMNDAQDVEILSAKYETYYANWFCEGDKRAAKVQMLSKRGDGLELDWSQLQLGYRMGMCAVLAIWVCWDCIWGLVGNGYSTIGSRAAFPIFRACGGLLLLQWFWGCSVFIWTRYRVNYIFLFDLIPSTVSTPFNIFTQAVNNTLIFMLLMLLYYKSGAQDMPHFIPPGGYPLILIMVTMLKLVFPRRQRNPMWHTIFKVVLAPWFSPNFFQTYVGDILTSMVKIFQDITWSICWVIAGDFMASDESKHPSFHWSKTHWYRNILIPVVMMMPLVFRFNQCLRKFSETGDRFPHLANATKYALSILVTLFGTFHPLYLEYVGKNSINKNGLQSFYQIFWTFLFVVSSLYSFTWDVYMDWGLGDKKHGFLNQFLMYPRKSYYYLSITIDLILRFLWVLTLVPPYSGASFALPEYLNALSMMLELFRRTLWGFLRLENEHRNTATRFHDHRTEFVPLHFKSGHQHHYEEKKERIGTEVLQEVIMVAIIVGIFCFATVVAAQHANHFVTKERDL